VSPGWMSMVMGLVLGFTHTCVGVETGKRVGFEGVAHRKDQSKCDGGGEGDVVVVAGVLLGVADVSELVAALLDEVEVALVPLFEDEDVLGVYGDGHGVILRGGIGGSG